MEGELAAVVAAGGSELAVQRLRIDADAHGGNFKAALEHRVPHEDIAVEIPVVIVGSAAVVGLAGALEGLADLHQEHRVVLAADLRLPLVGSQIRVHILQFLRGDKEHLPLGLKGQSREGVAQGGGSVAQGTHDVPDGVLEIFHVPVGLLNVLLPVPLIHVDGVEVIHHFIPADSVHIRVEAAAGGELIALEGQALPLGQRMHHLAVGPHVGDVKGDRALHAVEVVVEAGVSVHKQGGGDPVQIQPDGEAVLELRVDQFDGTLELVVGKRHLVAFGDDELAHGVYQSFL